MTDEKVKDDKSEGECTDDEDNEEDLDTSSCKACNVTFSSSMAFYSHIYSVSHLRQTSELAKSTLDPAAAGSAQPLLPPPPPPPALKSTSNLWYSDEAYVAPLDTAWHSSSQDPPLFSSGPTTSGSSFSESAVIPGLSVSPRDPVVSQQKNIAAATPFPRPPIMPLMSLPIVQKPFFHPTNGTGWMSDASEHVSRVTPLMSVWTGATGSENDVMSLSQPAVMPVMPEMVEFDASVANEDNLMLPDVQSHSRTVSVPPSQLLDEPEPLIGGRWLMTARKQDTTLGSFSCQVCKVMYNDKLLYDLHMAGLRHLKNSAELSEPSPVDVTNTAPESTATKKMNVTDMVERNASLYQQLSSYVGDMGITADVADSAIDAMGKKLELHDVTEQNVDLYDVIEPSDSFLSTNETSQRADANVTGITSEAVGKKMNVADILERNVDVFQKLSSYVAPILGVDYISEYHFLDGRVEHVCHLCELTLNIPANLTEHASSTTHLLRYTFYHEPSSFKLISDAGKCEDASFVQHIAADIEKKLGQHLRARICVENALPTAEFGVSMAPYKLRWVEQKDDRIRPVSALPGHMLNTAYTFASLPGDSSPIADLPSLLQALARFSCCASGRPPSLVKTLGRMDLLCSLAVFEVTNDNDAEVSLQIANALTLGLLNYRMQMLPALRATDRQKFEPRITRLHEEAESVAAKTSCRTFSVEQASNNVVTASSV